MQDKKQGLNARQKVILTLTVSIGLIFIAIIFSFILTNENLTTKFCEKSLPLLGAIYLERIG